MSDYIKTQMEIKLKYVRLPNFILTDRDEIKIPVKDLSQYQVETLIDGFARDMRKAAGTQGYPTSIEYEPCPNCKGVPK